MLRFRLREVITAIAASVSLSSAQTSYPAMVKGICDSVDFYTTAPLVTIGDSVYSMYSSKLRPAYLPVGIPDGIAAWKIHPLTVRVFVNHELSETKGYPYHLENGTTLTGARISYFDINRFNRSVIVGGLAYTTVYCRTGNIVTDARQINETAADTLKGFSRFCSSQGINAGPAFGFVDDIYLTGEESSKGDGHPHGGSFWALNADRELWALPALGRGAWESATPVAISQPGYVALALGDDVGGAPLYLYIGKKKHGNFLNRNGLSKGKLYAWVADDSSVKTPVQFNGTGSILSGHFVEISVKDASLANTPGYDHEGYLDDITLRDVATSTLGAFRFSRPEDLHTNPENASEFVFASTGRSQLFGGADSWGTVYKVNFNGSVHEPKATITILYDGNEDDKKDEGIRNPDNLVWANDGLVYINEDRSVTGFGANGREASIWKLDPGTFTAKRIAMIDRGAVAPYNATDPVPSDVGNWETSGIVDVTPLFPLRKGEQGLFLSDVQAHSITNGLIGGTSKLAEGGQIFFLSHFKK